MIRVLLVLAAVASLLGGGWVWLMTFAAGMSDSPSAAAEMTPGPIWLFGLPALAVVLFVVAWWVGG